MPALPLRLTLLAAVTVSATAQETPKVEIKAAADAYVARRDDTASRIVVGHDDIVRYGDTSLLDVLKRLPGVTVAGGAGRGGEVRMRGLGSGYTQILIDGERAPAGFSIESLAPAMVERIEIMRVASAEFSTQAIAGTINIVLKRAIRTAQREWKLGLAGGDGASVMPNASLQISDKSARLAYSLGIQADSMRYDRPSLITERGSDAAGDTTLLRRHQYVQRANNRELSITPRLVWTLENGDTLSSQTWLSAGRSRQSTDDPVSTVTGDAPAYPVVRGSEETRGHRARTELNWVRTTASGLKLDLRLGGFALRQDRATTQLGSETEGGPVLLGDQVSLPSREHGFSTTGKLSQKVGEQHALVFGWDGGITSGTDIRNQEVYVAADVYPGEPVERYDARVKRMAAYAQDEWNVTPAWSVYLGVRWEGTSTAVDGTDIASFTSRSGVWTPVFQTLYKVPGSKGDQWRLGLTRTYKAPSLFRLSPRRNRSANNSKTELDSQGNPLLRPETAVGLDLAYEHYWADGALISASASGRAISDYTRQDAFTDTGGRQVLRPINDGKAHTRGIELEAKFPLKSLLPDAPALDLRASMSRNWSSVDAVPGPDNRVAQQMPFAASVGADYAGAVLSGGASYTVRINGRTQFSPTLSSSALARRELDAYVLWKLTPKEQLRLAANNLLGQDFHSERVYTDANGQSRRIWDSPASPSVRLTLELRY